jgi:hypothetical protein
MKIVTENNRIAAETLQQEWTEAKQKWTKKFSNLYAAKPSRLLAKFLTGIRSPHLKVQFPGFSRDPNFALFEKFGFIRVLEFCEDEICTKRIKTFS